MFQMRRGTLFFAAKGTFGRQKMLPLIRIARFQRFSPRQARGSDPKSFRVIKNAVGHG